MLKGISITGMTCWRIIISIKNGVSGEFIETIRIITTERKGKSLDLWDGVTEEESEMTQTYLVACWVLINNFSYVK